MSIPKSKCSAKQNLFIWLKSLFYFCIMERQIWLQSCGNLLSPIYPIKRPVFSLMAMYFTRFWKRPTRPEDVQFTQSAKLQVVFVFYSDYFLTSPGNNVHVETQWSQSAVLTRGIAMTASANDTSLNKPPGADNMPNRGEDLCHKPILPAIWCHVIVSLDQRLIGNFKFLYCFYWHLQKSFLTLLLECCEGLSVRNQEKIFVLLPYMWLVNVMVNTEKTTHIVCISVVAGTDWEQKNGPGLWSKPEQSTAYFTTAALLMQAL